MVTYLVILALDPLASWLRAFPTANLLITCLSPSAWAKNTSTASAASSALLAAPRPLCVGANLGFLLTNFGARFAALPQSNIVVPETIDTIQALTASLYHLVHQHSKNVKAETKRRVIQQTPQASLYGVGDLGCRYAQPKGRVHDQEGRQHGDYPEEHRRQQCWLAQPVVTNEGDKCAGERDANHVVRSPANSTLSAFLASRFDARMFEDPCRHIANPAPNQTEVGRRNGKGVFEQERPQVKGEGGAEPNEDYANEEVK